MNFHKLPLAGALLIETEPLADERGSFARTFCARELGEQGVDFETRQCNISRNRRRGTLRGIHFQEPPGAEAKIVACVRGAVYDVIVDLRPESPARLQWHGVELSEENGMVLYVPVGFAHGFQTLEDNTTLYYQMSEYYDAGRAAGLRWDDPALGIRWPLPDPVVSDRDRRFPLL